VEKLGDFDERRSPAHKGPLASAHVYMQGNRNHVQHS
jgi:hypothetical protein